MCWGIEVLEKGSFCQHLGATQPDERHEMAVGLYDSELFGASHWRVIATPTHLGLDGGGTPISAVLLCIKGVVK